MIKEAYLVDEVPTLSNDHIFLVSKAMYVDVRRDDEFVGELGHIQGADLITLGPDLDSFLEKTPKEQSIVFICRSGARSAKATLQAISQGFTDVYNMSGGMIGWNESGKPVLR